MNVIDDFDEGQYFIVSGVNILCKHMRTQGSVMPNSLCMRAHYGCFERSLSFNALLDAQKKVARCMIDIFADLIFLANLKGENYGAIDKLHNQLYERVHENLMMQDDFYISFDCVIKRYIRYLGQMKCLAQPYEVVNLVDHWLSRFYSAVPWWRQNNHHQIL